MVSEISNNVTSLQALNAVHAFRKAAQQKTTGEQVQDEAASVELSGGLSQKVQTSAPSTVPAQYQSYINDIKQFMNGKVDASDDEIGYAIKYGRSILVDQMA
jgi:hypothetical protein